MRQQLGLLLVAGFLCLPNANGQTTAAQGAVASQPAGSVVDLIRFIDPAKDPSPAEKREEIEKTLRTAESPEDKATAELALANWLLSEPTVRPATRWLIGIPAEGDAKKIGELAKEAQEHLRRARTLLKPDLSNVRKLRSSATVLEAFAKSLAAVGAASGKECVKCTDAAIGLAAARESDKPNVAAAALLWQSFAWELAGKQDRALTSLPQVLTPPQELPYDLFARLLRCRTLADAGQPEAALPLAIRIRGLSDKWFNTQPAEVQAAQQRLVVLVQYRIALAWRARLKDASAIAQLDGIIAGIRKQLDSGGEVYTLSPAVPLLVQPPTIQPGLSSLPASTPASAAASEPSDK